jgi:tRNA threonylcarbamoyladenosine biosynthesis protein TsaE
LGEAWGREITPGWVVALSGDLGAGKTQLVKGLARGLGIVARVHSPTFALLQVYAGGRLPLAHLDLYRLDNAEAVLRAGLEEYLRPGDGVAVVEWAERWFDGVTPERGPGGPRFLRRVRLECLEGDERRIDYEDAGA